MKDYTYDGRHGIDLVFRTKNGRSVIHTVVEAKGYSIKNPVTGISPNLKADNNGFYPGSRDYSIDRLTRTARNGNRDAAYLLARDSQGKVSYVTSFFDGDINW